MSVIVFVTCLLLLGGNAVFAEPYLMLDAMMPDGSPPPTSDPEMGIFTSGRVFTLYALVNSEAPEAIEDPFQTETFFLAVAVIPDPGESFPGPDLGSYIFDGTSYDIVGTGEGAMKYGTPPLEEFLKQHDLPSHGVYETYFHEYSFELDLDNNAPLYNSMVTPGGPDLSAGGTLYYQAFSVDASGLDPDYELHFDLYTKGSPYIDKFAPFSHDLTTTPVPASVILGILGLGVVGLKLRKFA